MKAKVLLLFVSSPVSCRVSERTSAPAFVWMFTVPRACREEEKKCHSLARQPLHPLSYLTAEAPIVAETLTRALSHRFFTFPPTLVPLWVCPCPALPSLGKNRDLSGNDLTNLLIQSSGSRFRGRALQTTTSVFAGMVAMEDL